MTTVEKQLQELPAGSKIELDLGTLLRIIGSPIPDQRMEFLSQPVVGTTEGIPEVGLVWFPDLEETVHVGGGTMVGVLEGAA